MSDMGDKMIEYEEQHYEELVEKFLQKDIIKDAWEQFVTDQFNENLRDIEPPEQEDY